MKICAVILTSVSLLSVARALVSGFTVTEMVMNVVFFYQQPLSRSKTVFITPNSLWYMAEYLDNSVTIETNVIRVTTGSTNEHLIEVPLAAAGELDPQATIRLTVGFDEDLVTSSNHLRVGVYDLSLIHI